MCGKCGKRLCWDILDHSSVFKVLYLERQERNVRDSWISQMQQQMALVLKGQLLLILLGYDKMDGMGIIYQNLLFPNYSVFIERLGCKW